MQFMSFLALAVKTTARNARGAPTDTQILVGEGRLCAFVAVTLVAEAKIRLLQGQISNGLVSIPSIITSEFIYLYASLLSCFSSPALSLQAV